jgi:hypothetical protein
LRATIILTVLSFAVAGFAGTIGFVQPSANTTVDRGSELDVIVRNTTDENAPVYLISDGADREIFKALANDTTTFILDTGELAPGSYILETSLDGTPAVNVSIKVNAAGTESDLPKVYPLPNPFDLSSLTGEVNFVNTPADSVIKVFDMSGREVTELSGPYTWDGRNERGDLVSSGTYVYHISSPGGLKFTGKLAVVK